MTPGNDSFQNEIIRAAGGIAPDFGKAGKVVPVTREEFMAFNPQVVYGCGDDLTTAGTQLESEGFRDADAVKNGRLLTFPCHLTCRSGVHLGDFVSWLSARTYAEEFADSARSVLPREIVEKRPMDLSFDHVKEARVAVSMIDDFENKTLIIDFKTPRTVVSTLDGLRSGVASVGNHYSPPPSWSLNHGAGLDELRSTLCRVIGKEPEKSVFLFTGADMDHLSVKTERFKTMTVTALVTAGVRGNAMRMGTDSGDYYEPGTINVIVLTNMAMSVRAMTRAIITATEAKTAALWDLDVRSSYTPLSAAATGTGTDNVLVAPGDGALIDNAGGHSKMGELIARAVYAGVREAVARQNGLEGGRDVFQRLEERRVTLSQLVAESRSLTCDAPADLHVRMERLLLDPVYAGVVENALALSDDLARGAVRDLTVFENSCLNMASRIAGKTLDHLVFDLSALDLPIPLALAMNALLSGAVYQSPIVEGLPSADCGCR
jgi:adenosylcobinamide amidohydrolase